MPMRTQCAGQCCRSHPFGGVCAHGRRCDYHRAQDARRARQERDAAATIPSAENLLRAMRRGTRA